MIPKGISDKYQVEEILQEKAATAVVLVRHKQIGDLRILKIISNNHPEAEDFLSEANLIAGINSPRVPTIYDVGQLDDCYYFVENYIPGQSLKEFLLTVGYISKREILEITMQLCKIIKTLHTCVPEAIIYRDLKPEHVIIYENKVYLIDFGIAVKKSQVNKARRCGTKSWAAPELLAGGFFDERCDVYGVGRIIDEMLNHCREGELMRLKSIVVQATEAELEKRTCSINQLMCQLTGLQETRKNNKKEKYLKKKIAVIGMDKAVGCTHIAIGLTMYLNSKGYNTVYFDRTGSNTVKKISRALKNYFLEDGILYHNNFAGYMDYGPAVEKNMPPDCIQILDYGVDDTKYFDVDKIVYVVSSCQWKELVQLPAWINEKEVTVVTNFSSRMSTILLAKSMNKRIYAYPQSNRNLKLLREEKKLFQLMLKKEEYFEKI